MALPAELPPVFCARLGRLKARTPRRLNEAHESFERVEISFIVNLTFEFLDAQITLGSFDELPSGCTFDPDTRTFTLPIRWRGFSPSCSCFRTRVELL